MQRTIVNAQPNINGADLYGIRAKMLLGVEQRTAVSQASGAISPNSITEAHPAFSWVSLVVVLIVIRLLQEMIPEG